METAPAYLSALALVLAVLGEEAAEEVSAAAGHVDQRALLPQAETRRHRQNQGDRLDQQGPFPQVAPDDEAAEDCFDLHKTTNNICEFFTVQKQKTIYILCFVSVSLTSGIPDPQAYGANTRTSDTARKENSRAHRMYRK